MVMKLFDALKGALSICKVKFVGLSDEHTLHSKELTIHWKEAAHWVEWWTRLPHLKMLCESFSEVTRVSFGKAPKDTNGVERVNLESKQFKFS